MVAKSFLKIALALALSALVAPRSGAAETSRQRLSPSRSSAEFSMASDAGTVSGTLRDISGALLLDEEDFTRSKVVIGTDLSNVALSSSDQFLALTVQGLIQSLPDPRVRFESTSIKRLADRRYQVLGTARVQGRERQVSFPMTVAAAGRSRSEFRAVLASNLAKELAAPPALAPLLGRAEAELKLVFE